MSPQLNDVCVVSVLIFDLKPPILTVPLTVLPNTPLKSILADKLVLSSVYWIGSLTVIWLSVGA